MSVVEYAWVEAVPAEPLGSMPIPRLLVLVEEKPGAYTLWSFSGDGEHAGDTVHVTREEAHEQAIFAHGARLGRWTETEWTPDDARDQARSLLRGALRGHK